MTRGGKGEKSADHVSTEGILAGEFWETQKHVTRGEGRGYLTSSSEFKVTHKNSSFPRDSAFFCVEFVSSAD